MPSQHNTDLGKAQIAGDFFPSRRLTVLYSILLVALTAIVFKDTAMNMAREWMTRTDASQGALVPIVVGFLIWNQRDLFSSGFAGKSNFLILIVVILSLLFYFVGRASLVLILERVGFWLFLSSSFVFLIGVSAARKLTFPILFSLFMIPVPVTIYDYLTFPLKKIATTLSVKTLQLFSVPVYQDGNVMHLPGVTLEVLNACSGLNSILSVLFVGVLLGYFLLKSNVRRVIFFVLLIPIALAANTMRIIITALVSNYYTQSFTQGLMHEMSGTLLVLAFALLFITVAIAILK